MPDTTFREVHLVTFEPTGSEGGIGGLNWFPTREEAEAHYEHITTDSDYEDDLIAQWNAYVPEHWDNEDVTDYLDDTFNGEDPSGYPVRTHNAPHSNWPFENVEN